MAGKRGGRRIISLLGGGLAALLLLVGFVWFVRTMMTSKSGKQERQVQIVQIIRPPPPPPPDQPPPPPPPKADEALPRDEPQPAPNETPAPAQPLGIDADGAAGGDAFGLAARHGGNDLVGGNGGAVFAWYTNRIKDAIAERLAANSKLGAKKFSASVSVWIEPDGKVRGQLMSTTGNRELDQQIESVLSSMTRLSDPPPVEMPQPVTLKIVSHT